MPYRLLSLLLFACIAFLGFIVVAIVLGNTDSLRLYVASSVLGVALIMGLWCTLGGDDDELQANIVKAKMQIPSYDAKIEKQREAAQYVRDVERFETRGRVIQEQKETVITPTQNTGQELPMPAKLVVGAVIVGFVIFAYATYKPPTPMTDEERRYYSPESYEVRRALEKVYGRREMERVFPKPTRSN